jgi:hypothetical protein
MTTLLAQRLAERLMGHTINYSFTAQMCQDVFCTLIKAKLDINRVVGSFEKMKNTGCDAYLVVFDNEIDDVHKSLFTFLQQTIEEEVQRNDSGGSLLVGKEESKRINNSDNTDKVTVTTTRVVDDIVDVVPKEGVGGKKKKTPAPKTKKPPTPRKKTEKKKTEKRKASSDNEERDEDERVESERKKKRRTFAGIDPDKKIASIPFPDVSQFKSPTSPPAVENVMEGDDSSVLDVLEALDGIVADSKE